MEDFRCRECGNIFSDNDEMYFPRRLKCGYILCASSINEIFNQVDFTCPNCFHTFIGSSLDDFSERIDLQQCLLPTEFNCEKVEPEDSNDTITLESDIDEIGSTEKPAKWTVRGFVNATELLSSGSFGYACFADPAENAPRGTKPCVLKVMPGTKRPKPRYPEALHTDIGNYLKVTQEAFQAEKNIMEYVRTTLGPLITILALRHIFSPLKHCKAPN